MPLLADVSPKTMADAASLRQSIDRALPEVRSKRYGPMGPGIGVGIGCGVGVGVGVVGAVGILGGGFPGLHLGFGVGAGCGVGVGYGYGYGAGRAYDLRSTDGNGAFQRRPGRTNFFASLTQGAPWRAPADAGAPVPAKAAAPPRTPAWRRRTW